jgi:endonuclease/exonuclease/phosphatase (EEP) superfamily protein YafD
MTLNQAQGTLDAARLIHLIEQYNVKVICFQEGYCPPEGRPDPILEQYFSKAWYRNKNLTIASRFPITAEFEPLENPDVAPWFWKARVNRARLKLPSGQEFLVADVHMPTMHFAFQRLAQGHLADFQQHITWRGEKMGIVAAALADTHDLPLLVGGDFNMPSDSTLMPALRLAGLHDAFGEAGWGYGYTRPSGIPWAGIDHILGGPEWTFTHCWVGPDVGSDHLPLLAEVVLSKEGAAGDLRPE